MFTTSTKKIYVNHQLQLPKEKPMSFPTSKAQVVHSSASHKGEAQALVTFLLTWEDHPSGPRKWLIPMLAYVP